MRSCLGILALFLFLSLLLPPAPALNTTQNEHAGSASTSAMLETSSNSTILSDPEAGALSNLSQMLITITVLDSSTNDTLPARCSIHWYIGGDPYPSYPPSDVSFYHTAEGGYFYTSGVFSVSVAAGSTRVRIGRGPEYRPIVESINVSGDTSLVFHLNRWIDMMDLHWYSGDCHVHIDHSGGFYTLTPVDAHFLGTAEGLNVVNCLDNGYFFTGGPDPCSTPECIVYMSEEYRSGTYGHLGLLGLSQIFRPGSSMWWPMTMDIADIIHFRPGAVVIAAHPVSTDDFWPIDTWPGTGLARELPMDVIAGRMDGFEIMSYSNCHPGGIEIDMWYRLLNCGFKLPACGGTDSGMNRRFDRPLGGFRTYVFIPDAEFNFDNWLTQLTNGRTFVTNGPLITRFDLQGLLPGDSLPLPSGIWRLNGRLSARCAYPMEKAEIIQNGEVVKLFPVDGRCSIDTSFSLYIEESSWVAARVSGVDSFWHPVGDTLFAHTSPIYIPIQGRRLIKREDAEFFVDWIEDLETLVLQNGEWNFPSDSQRVLNEITEARDFYAALADAATYVDRTNPNTDLPALLLKQNSPNPFSSGTTIEFGIPSVDIKAASSFSEKKEPTTFINLTIYDVQGKVVKKLHDGPLPSGIHRLLWNGRDNRERPVSSGVYFYRLRAGDLSASRKMLLLR